MRATARDAATSRSWRLERGRLTLALVVDGLPIAELPTGVRLRVGDTAVVELGPSGPSLVELAGGIASGETGPRPAEVLDAGTVEMGDAVTIDAVTVPLTDMLDLHSFRPEDVLGVVTEYLGEARRAGLAEVRLVHGRGRGVQRAVVRRLLAGVPGVAGFTDAPPERGGWGATLVRLRPAEDPPSA